MGSDAAPLPPVLDGVDPAGPELALLFSELESVDWELERTPFLLSGTLLHTAELLLLLVVVEGV